MLRDYRLRVMRVAEAAFLRLRNFDMGIGEEDDNGAGSSVSLPSHM